MAASVVSAGIASTIVGRFGSPLRFASSCHSLEYPFPLKMIRLCFSVYSTISAFNSLSKSSAFSSLSQASSNASAAIVFKTTLQFDRESWEPSIRNSNLFPVKANGDVRLRSVASLRKSGSVVTPVANFSPLILWVASPFFRIWSSTSSSWSPRNTEMTAGGASLPPSL